VSRLASGNAPPARLAATIAAQNRGSEGDIGGGSLALWPRYPTATMSKVGSGRRTLRTRLSRRKATILGLRQVVDPLIGSPLLIFLQQGQPLCAGKNIPRTGQSTRLLQALVHRHRTQSSANGPQTIRLDKSEPRPRQSLRWNIVSCLGVRFNPDGESPVVS
jgi:hypothetical protein